MDSSKTADWIAIRAVTAEWARAVDSRDPAGLAAIVTADAIVEVVDERIHQGRDEIAEIALRPRGDVLHMTTDPVIEIRGDEATQDCRFLIVRAARAEAVPVEMVEAGTYHDSLTRIGGRWHFSRRTIRLLRPDAPTS